MQLDLVDGGHGRAGRILQELLEVLDGKVADADGLDLARGGQLLQLLPGLDEIPVGKVLLAVVGIGRAGPVHEVEVDVVGAEVAEGRVDACRDAVVPGVVQLGGQEDFRAGDAGFFDAEADFVLVAVC